MRVLTVRQPWAWAVIHGGKDVENRTRNIAGTYRGPVAIHAAAREAAPYNDVAEEVFRLSRHWVLSSPLAAIVGVVDLVDVHHSDDAMKCVDWAHGVTDDGTYLPCSPWAMENHHHLIFANARALATPIPARGRLGLWKPDDGLLWAIRAQIGTPALATTEEA